MRREMRLSNMDEAERLRAPAQTQPIIMQAGVRRASGLVLSNRALQLTLFSALLLAGYFALATCGIHEQNLDVDELTSSEVIRLDSSILVRNRLLNGHPPLYFILLRGWIGATAHREWALVLFSIVAGALGIPGMLLLAGEMGLSARARGLAGLLWALHPTVFFLNRYVRPYAGVGTLACILIWLILRSLSRPKATNLCALFIVGIVGSLWNHTLLIIWLASLTGVFLLSELNRRATRGFWRVAGLCIASHMGMLGLCFVAFEGIRPLDWIPRASLRSISHQLLILLGSKDAEFLRVGTIWFIPLTLIVGVATLLQRIIRGNRRPSAGLPAFDADKWKLILLLTLLPLAAAILLSYAIRPILVYRYLLVALPGFILSLAWTIDAIPKRWLGTTIAISIAVVLIWEDAKVIRRGNGPGIRDIITQLDREYDPEASERVMVLSPGVREAVFLYSNRPHSIFLVPWNLSPEKAWPILRENIAQGGWLWTLTRRYPGRLLIDDPRWEQEAGEWISAWEQGEWQLRVCRTTLASRE